MKSIFIISIFAIVACTTQPMSMPIYHEALKGEAPEIYVQVTAIREERHSRSEKRKVYKSASGVWLDSGIVVTAAHVLGQNYTEAIVTRQNGKTMFARLVAIFPQDELAILRLQKFTHFTPEKNIVTSIPTTGATVLAIGLSDNRSGTVRVGKVVDSHSERRFRFGSFGFKNPIVVDATIESGFSGGPVVDVLGAWIGMVVGHNYPSTIEQKKTETYVIPAFRILDYVKKYLDSSPNVLFINH